jgi:acetylornithine deacetylase
MNKKGFGKFVKRQQPAIKDSNFLDWDEQRAKDEMDRLICSKQGSWVRLLQELVRLSSVFEDEEKVVDLVNARLESFGINTVSVPFDPNLLARLRNAQRPISAVQGRRNLVARLPGRGGGGRSLVLNCHLDVVPAGNEGEWTRPPFAGHVENGLIYGRGAYDDKAGVAICLAVLESLAASRAERRGDVVVHFVLEDECTGNGSLLCLEAGHGGDAAIIIDGTRLDKGINQHAGNCQVSVRVKGRPASVSVSHVGINAAEMLASLLLEMRQAIFARNVANEAPWTRFPSPNQFIIQSLRAHGPPLTVPAAAMAQAYITFTPPARLADIRVLLGELAEEFARKTGLPEPPALDWSGFAAEPVISASAGIVAAINEAARRQGMDEIDFGPSTGTSDMRHFVDRGIPCVLYGPGMGFNPHRADEHYHLDSLPKIVRLLIDLVGQWCE